MLRVVLTKIQIYCLIPIIFCFIINQIIAQEFISLVQISFIVHCDKKIEDHEERDTKAYLLSIDLNYFQPFKQVVHSINNYSLQLIKEDSTINFETLKSNLHSSQIPDCIKYFTILLFNGLRFLYILTLSFTPL